MTAQPLADAPALGNGPIAEGAPDIQGFGWLTPAVEDAALASGDCLPGRTAPPQAWPRGVVTMTPGSQPGALKQARDSAITILRRWGVRERCGDIAIVVSELLTNALRHALPAHREIRPGASSGEAIRLGLVQPGSWVLCAVSDPSQRLPVAQDPGPLADGGRGLHIVEALSDNWGCAPLGGHGKIVWAMFADPPGRALSAGPAGARREGT